MLFLVSYASAIVSLGFFAAGCSGLQAKSAMSMQITSDAGLMAARVNDALFLPITPGLEDESWRRLHSEALERFFRGQYAGGYEKKLIDEFDRRLPEKPPWAR